jgi:hypothetical protein
MSVTAAIRKMLAAGLTIEQALIASDAFEAEAPKDAQAERRRAKDRERKRLRNSAESVESAEQVSPKKEIPPPPPKEKTTPSSSEARASSLNPRGELELVLDAERAKAVLDHRQRIGKPLTAYAAKQLAAKMAQCPDPNAAADEMVSNGWQGFKPEWLTSRANSQQGPPRQGGVSGAAQRIIESEKNGSDGESIFSHNGNAQRLPAAGSGGPRNASADLPGGIGRQFVTIDH